MRIAQLGKQLGKSLEHELAYLFIALGDNQLPEEAHTPGHVKSIRQGMDASGVGGDNTLKTCSQGTAPPAPITH